VIGGVLSVQVRSVKTVCKVVEMNPYTPPAGEPSFGTSKPVIRWPLRKRLRLFIGFAFTSLVLTFGLFHAFFIVYLGDPEPLGTDVAHRYIMAIIGIGLPIQCLLSAFAFSRRLGWTMVICNCFVLGVQLLCVYGIIQAVLSGP
jgi:hypothetical protein